MAETTTLDVRVTTPVCVVCGLRGSVTLVSIEEVLGFVAWLKGELVQRALPEWSAERREQLMNGTHPVCWEAMMADLGEEDD